MAETPELFNTIASRYDRLSNLLSADGIRAWRSAAMDHMDLHPGLQVLDVGCGTGTATVQMAKKVMPQGTVTGLDPSRDMLAQAQHQAQASRLPNTEWVLASAEALPFVDQQFDRISAFFSLRNMQDWRIGLNEMRRVLNPGGRVVLLDMLQPTTTLGSLAMHGLKTITTPMSGEELEPFRWLPRSLLHAPTSDELTARMEAQGFRVQSTHHWLGDLVTMVVATYAEEALALSPIPSLGTTIVWATDGSEASHRAGRWLVRHALKPSSTVHAITVCPPFDGSVSEALKATDLVSWEHALEQSRQLLEPGCCAGVISRLLFGPTAATIADYTREVQADWLVMGQKHRSGGSRRMMGRTEEQVSAAVSIPVLVIRDEPEKKHPEHQPISRPESF
ncbi:MAG: ubiquinone/menaquinone biosynthesis methyltransferase [Firmicutes bacterium]|jgi:demethylmenaquinone methyltransferase/2-methoxy-6-polyprenyl-1,4-benzoquinol methylase|nr:ubiquinone/menaquinone biosynthesis methyltransferase [Bacillota bacterium]MCL5065873.1 ubiquinone/menaquinone biosynthesis methyltransferase [Bacillota bacterium]